jgi:hypothetical protein
MAGPFDPHQMPRTPDEPDGGNPRKWRVVDPAIGRPPAGYPSQPGYPNHPSSPNMPSAPNMPSNPGTPGYGGYEGAQPEATPPWTPPASPTQWGPGQPIQFGAGQPSQWGQGQWQPGPTSQGSAPTYVPWREDPRLTGEGWGPLTEQQGGLQGFPELQPLEPRRPSPLVIAACVLMALVLVAIAGAGIAYTQYHAPGNAAAGFCNHLISQDYGATYEDLATSLQSRYAPDAFVASARLTDKLLGPVTSCTAATSGSGYHFNLGGSSAQVTISLMRAQAGSFSEVVTLLPDHGRWRLQQLNAELFGLDLQPLIVASTFCVDLQAHDYAALYGLLDAHARGAVKQADFVQQGALHEEIDGPASSCTVLSIVKSSSPSASSLSVILGVNRKQTATEQGQVTVSLQNGTWLVDAFAGNLLGSDLTPLTVGAQFCSALVAGNYDAAYTLLSDRDKSVESEPMFAYDMSGNGLIKWTGCTPDYTSYKATGGSVSYTTNMQATAPAYGANFAPGVQLTFVKQGNRWLVDDAMIVY